MDKNERAFPWIFEVEHGGMDRNGAPWLHFKVAMGDDTVGAIWSSNNDASKFKVARPVVCQGCGSTACLPYLEDPDTHGTLASALAAFTSPALARLVAPGRHGAYRNPFACHKP